MASLVMILITQQGKFHSYCRLGYLGLLPPCFFLGQAEYNDRQLSVVTMHSHGTTPQENCSIISSCFSVCCQAESKWKANNLCVTQVKW